MTRSFVRFALISGLSLGGAGGAVAQTEFPMKVSGATYSQPVIGVVSTGPIQEGRSAYVAPRRGEISGKFDRLSLPADDEASEPDE